MPGLWLSKFLAGVLCAVALLIVTVLSAPVWLIGPFFPRYQNAANKRLALLITWTGTILSRDQPQ